MKSILRIIGLSIVLAGSGVSSEPRSVIVATQETRLPIKGKVGDHLLIAMASNLVSPHGGRKDHPQMTNWGFYNTHQWTEYKVATHSGLRAFTLLKSNNSSFGGRRSWLFRCDKPGKYLFPIRSTLRLDGTFSQNTDFNIYIEISK